MSFTRSALLRRPVDADVRVLQTPFGVATATVTVALWVFAHLVLLGLGCIAENVERSPLGVSICDALPNRFPREYFAVVLGVGIVCALSVVISRLAGLAFVAFGGVLLASVALLSLSVLSQERWDSGSVLFVALDLLIAVGIVAGFAWRPFR